MFNNNKKVQVPLDREAQFMFDRDKINELGYIPADIRADSSDYDIRFFESILRGNEYVEIHKSGPYHDLCAFFGVTLHVVGSIHGDLDNFEKNEFGKYFVATPTDSKYFCAETIIPLANSVIEAEYFAVKFLHLNELYAEHFGDKQTY